MYIEKTKIYVKEFINYKAKFAYNKIIKIPMEHFEDSRSPTKEDLETLKNMYLVTA